MSGFSVGEIINSVLMPLHQLGKCLLTARQTLFDQRCIAYIHRDISSFSSGVVHHRIRISHILRNCDPCPPRGVEQIKNVPDKPGPFWRKTRSRRMKMKKVYSSLLIMGAVLLAVEATSFAAGKGKGSGVCTGSGICLGSAQGSGAQLRQRKKDGSCTASSATSATQDRLRRRDGSCQK